jgi:hypothetical protein
MDLVDALTRVLELARAAISELDCGDGPNPDPDIEACTIVEDYMVKHLGSNPRKS